MIKCFPSFGFFNQNFLLNFIVLQKKNANQSVKRLIYSFFQITTLKLRHLHTQQARLIQQMVQESSSLLLIRNNKQVLEKPSVSYWPRYVIDEKRASCAAVIRTSNWTKAFLASLRKKILLLLISSENAARDTRINWLYPISGVWVVLHRWLSSGLRIRRQSSNRELVETACRWTVTTNTTCRHPCRR